MTVPGIEGIRAIHGGWFGVRCGSHRLRHGFRRSQIPELACRFVSLDTIWMIKYNLDIGLSY